MPIQARLRVGEPNDPYEHEAERVAEQVMRMSDSAATPTVQRKCSACERDDERDILQREGGSNATMPASVPAAIDGLRSSGGQPLPGDVRDFFEPRFGADFSSVRVHANPSGEQAARDLHARAFTIGRDVVFGPGQYQPYSPAGRRLLAHELTHVIHQGATQRAGTVQSRVQPMIQRDDDDRPPPSAAENRAGFAELTCDIRTLCAVHFAEPGVVTTERLRRMHARCFPSVRLTFPNPCLLPNFGLPSAEPSSDPMRPTPPRTGDAPSSSGGLSLPSTNIRFQAGPLAGNISLPANLAARLPVPFRGAERVVFALDASLSGFTFNVTINAVPHVRIIARAGVTTTGTGSAGLIVEATRTVCRAVDELAARTALQTAGTRLRDAIMAVQNPPPLAADASDFERDFAAHKRFADVVIAIADVHTQIEHVRARCRPVPLMSLEFGARGPLSAPGPSEPPSRGETHLGVTGTLRF